MSIDTDVTLSTEPIDITRRALLRWTALVGAAGVSAVSVTACGGDDGAGSAADGTTSPGADTSSPTAPASEPASSAAAPPAGATGAVLIKAAEVPVGSAVVTEGPDGAKYVVVQATQGQFTGLSATCTHQRCTVGVAGDRLDCPCHGSRYSFTGAVLRGPATAPLPPAAVALSGEDVVVA